MVTFGHHSSSLAILAQCIYRAQAIRNGQFCKYDYGAKKNMEFYGQEEPPLYKLGTIDHARVPSCPCPTP